MQGLRSLLYCPVTTPNLDATSGLPIRKASFLARWGKRDSEEQGSLGGSMARHEQNEDSPLTRLELGRLRPKTLLAREPWQLVSKIRIPQLTRLGFWAGAPTTRARGGNVEIFVVSNELLKTNSKCLMTMLWCRCHHPARGPPICVVIIPTSTTCCHNPEKFCSPI